MPLHNFCIKLRWCLFRRPCSLLSQQNSIRIGLCQNFQYKFKLQTLTHAHTHDRLYHQSDRPLFTALKGSCINGMLIRIPKPDDTHQSIEEGRRSSTCTRQQAPREADICPTYIWTNCKLTGILQIILNFIKKNNKQTYSYTTISIHKAWCTLNLHKPYRKLTTQKFEMHHKKSEVTTEDDCADDKRS